MNLLIAAISLGFLGSFHCVGMCGPIALALPVNRESRFKKFSGILLYNFGRILTYSGFGVLFGFVGKGFAIFGMQQALSVFFGSVILISVLFPEKFRNVSGALKPWFNMIASLKNKLSKQFSNKSLSSLFTIGLLNGLLPCGFVYMAIAGAVAGGGPLEGSLFMAGFGFGTVPAMLSVSWFADILSDRFRLGLKRIFPYVISVMAVLMILRGMDLGIPYLSPKMVQTQVSCHTQKICCHK